MSRRSTWKSLLPQQPPITLISYELHHFAVIVPEDYIKIVWVNCFRHSFAGGLQCGKNRLEKRLKADRNMATFESLSGICSIFPKLSSSPTCHDIRPRHPTPNLAQDARTNEVLWGLAVLGESSSWERTAPLITPLVQKSLG